MSAGFTYPAELNVADYFLDRHLREGRGSRIAVAGVGPPLTYEELADKAARAAGLFCEMGVAPAAAGRPGERVLLVLPDSPEWLACFYGAIKAGAVAVPVNPFTRAADYAYFAADSKPRLAVVHSMSFAEALPALASAATRVLTVGGRADGFDSFEELLASVSPMREAQSTTPNDIAFFLYTSGSGGQPKAAMHRHRHMLATSATFAAHVLGIGPEDVCFSASKLFFAYGLGNAGYFPFSVGAATVLLPERVTPEKIFAVLEEHKPTLFFAVPTLYGALLRAAEGTATQLDSVRLCISAGEALPAEIFARFRARFGREILDGIGTTEMLHMFMSNRAGAARPGSCGPLVTGYEARIVDEEGREVSDGEARLPDGQVGNLWVRGPSAMAGYWGQAELTARVLRDGWYSTNDKFTRDADGYFHYCGRADDMLKVSGLWVSPLEVENALLAHDGVAEAAVVGQRDADGLTRIVAYVVVGSGRARACPLPSAEAELLAAELRSFVHARLPGYKVPQEFRFVLELPKTATGKIQRFKLRV